jgi:uncharacterized protein YndB with AHSA1/START domain
MTDTNTAVPVVAEVTVPVDPARAFDLYVARPGRTHPGNGLSGSPEAIVYEPFVGGRWYERASDGSEHDWGRVVSWDPPHRLGLVWMVGVQDGRWVYDSNPEHASRVDLTFEAIGAGQTLVRVVHTGFEAHGAGAASIRDGVTPGWQEDLQDLRNAAEREQAPVR